MDGLLIIDKPAGITSHDVVASVRRILNTKRVGHTGTLDPFATGVMVILVGKATRLAQFLDKDDKEYEAVIQFGYETDTGDPTGSHDPGSAMQEAEVAARLSGVDWESVLDKFRGEIAQIPPMYSAKKIAGKKLYELARKGEVIEREPRHVSITWIAVEEIPDQPVQMKLGVTCSAGTYIRTLAEDIGRSIGVGAHLTALRRTRAGGFDLSKSVTLDDLAEAEDASISLLPVESAVAHLPVMELAPDRIEKTSGGLSTRIFDDNWDNGAFIQMLDDRSKLVAVGVYLKAENAVKPKIVLV
jgi:tRNA pseudouridine55 synthase